jgi:carbamoyl-phosphate synthase large subunit
MKRIFVTGAGGPAGINFIKSLRLPSEKFYIAGGDVNKWHLELSDVDSRYLLPKFDDPSYIRALNEVIKLEEIEFVHPQPDVEVAAISENRERIKAKTFLPDKKTVRICQDKMHLTEILKENDIPVPNTFNLSGEAEIPKALKTLLEVYPRKAWLRAKKGAGAKASLPVKEVSHAVMWIDYWKKMHSLDYNDFMLAEYLPGREFAFQSVWKDGELIVSQARERLEYIFPHLTPSGQTSSPAVARTVNRSDVNEIATNAVLAIDNKANGVFCIDMKENSKGIPCITEINAGRFFTTSNFFSEAGVNMPYIYIKLAYDEELPSIPKYDPLPEGLYWIRLIDGGHKLVKGEKWRSKKALS